MPNTIQIHHVLRAAPEKVYRAFLDPEATAKWPLQEVKGMKVATAAEERLHGHRRFPHTGRMSPLLIKICKDLKLVRCPRSLAPTLVTLPSMSLIPFASFGGDDVPFRIQTSAF